MKRNQIVTLVLCIGIGIILTAPAFSLMIYETLYEQLQRTDVIAVGTIVKKKIESDKTYNYFKPHRVIYGRLDRSTIPILTWGGSSSHVSDEASYDAGKPYLVFLRLEDWYYPKGRYYDTVLNFPSNHAEFQTFFDAIQPLLDIKNEPDGNKRLQGFLKMLKAENPYLVESAIVEVKKAKVQEALPDLIRLLQQRGEYRIKTNSIEALNEIGGKEAIAAIRSALHDSSPWVRSRAVQALGWMKVYEAEEDLIDLFRDKKEDKYVRRCAAMELGALHSTKALPYLEGALREEQNDRSSALRDDILMAIKRIKEFQKKLEK